MAADACKGPAASIRPPNPAHLRLAAPGFRPSFGFLQHQNRLAQLLGLPASEQGRDDPLSEHSSHRAEQRWMHPMPDADFRPTQLVITRLLSS
jgi:hypothetical protein